MEFIDAFKRLKVPKKVAALIAFLAGTGEATTREIEMGTGLRQPGVSRGMRALYENNWITERDVMAENKGRPRKVYSLRVSLGEIIKHYEKEKSHESARAMEAIQRLREITAT